MACSGGGGGADAGDATLFEDDFSRGLASWTASNTAAVQVDTAVGAPSAPSLLIDDVGTPVAAAELDVSPFSVAPGLLVSIRVAIPDDQSTAQTGVPDANQIIEITQNGFAVAGVAFVRKGAGSPNGTELRYWAGNLSRYRSEFVGWGAVTGQFSDYMFQVTANGDALWKKDGVTKLELTSGPDWPFPTSPGLGLRLKGAAGVGAKLPVHFDDVAVERLP